MSRRRDRAAVQPAGPAPGAERRRGSFALDLVVLVTVFAVVTGIAELAGAANLGVSLGIGQVAFALVLVFLLARR